jgi:uncharacterized protein (TIGR02246 family)
MDVAEDIRGVYRQYWDAEQSGDSEAIASFYTTDARLIPPGRGPLVGRSEIQQYFEGQRSSGVEADLTHIEVAGKLAWVTGFVSWQDDGQLRQLAFLDVWRQEKDGWQIAACMWNSADGFVLA